MTSANSNDVNPYGSSHNIILENRPLTINDIESLKQEMKNSILREMQ